ncbi:MAG: SRPBCC family protein [Candidatus Cyclobacteriaceae bacterium M3_2C_046]
MKNIKKIGVGVLGLIAVLMIISIFMPSDVMVERSVMIKAPKEEIFQQINNLKNWEKWSPWHQLDPNMELVYEGPESGEGAAYHWHSSKRNVGDGSLMITKSVPFELIEADMDFQKESPARASYKLEEQPEGVLVTWSLQTYLGPSPYYKYLGLFLDDLVGPEFEKGLHNIKVLLES